MIGPFPMVEEIPLEVSTPLHQSVILNHGPFVPHINSREPCYFAKVPDSPKTYPLNVLWLQEGAQIRMSE
jgi:hypothetical protein